MSNAALYGRGAKGSSSPRTAQIAAETLRSKSFARVLDLVSEGPIEGFVNDKGQLLRDGEITSVTVVGGTITALTIAPGSAGYPATPTLLTVTDETGAGAVIKV